VGRKRLVVDVCRKAKSTGKPGPGQYATTSGLGEQVTSTRSSAPKAKFGTSTRYVYSACCLVIPLLASWPVIWDA
jgi:hypothetical protein